MVLELVIEKLVAKGDGLARHEGKAIFVSGALPGERVLATITEEKKDYARAEVFEVLEASLDRVVPACPYYGVCGGCDLQHLSSEAQAREKEKIVRENLTRIGRIDCEDITVLPVAAADGWGYRSRVRLHADLEASQVGFLGRMSNDLVDIEHCPILCESLNRLLGEKRPLTFKAAAMRSATEAWQSRNPYLQVPALAGDTQVSLSSSEVDMEVSGKTLWADSNVFFQGNRLVLPAMIDFVKTYTSGSEILDLYAGVGTFAAFVEGPRRKVIAVERDSRCRELAKKNAKATEFVAQPIEKWIRTQPGKKVDTVIVDPPRAGLENKVVKALAALNPASIVYVSCDSVTLARDCSRLYELGYKVDTLQVFDLYPQTSHVEAAVHLKPV